jgi:phage I-like protein
VQTQRVKCEKSPLLLSKSAASGRFRIFPEGKFMTDYGPSVMTPKAGQEIIKKFRARGNNMMIDLRHFSISPTATAKQSEALGWIMQPNGLEYVDGDGLYATGVRWDPEVKAGLESDPPKWMYHSPYYDQDKKSKVITELLNIALTNMPATHNHSLLAAERSGPMDLKMLGALLLALSMAAEAGDETAKSYLAQLTAGLGDQAQPALDAASADVAAESVEDPMMAGMLEDEKTMVASMPDEMKATYMAGKKAMAAQVAAAAPVEDKVAAGMDLDTLTKIAAGIDAQNIDAKRKMVTEAIRAGLVPKSMEPHLMNSTEQVAASFIAGRRSKVVAIGGPVAKKINAPAPLTKTDPLPGVSKEDRIAAESLSKKTGTPVKDLLAQMIDKG